MPGVVYFLPASRADLENEYHFQDALRAKVLQILIRKRGQMFNKRNPSSIYPDDIS